MEMNIIIKISLSPEEKYPNVTIFDSRMASCIMISIYRITNWREFCSSTRMFIGGKSKYIESNMMQIANFFKKIIIRNVFKLECNIKTNKYRNNI